MDQAPAILAVLGAGSERPQKRMRKGTHSCTECRRRRIRCKPLPDVDTCAECSARGSKCISQGPTIGDESHGEPSHPSPARRNNNPHAPNLPSLGTPRIHADYFDLEGSSGPQPPLMAMLDQSKVHPTGPGRESKQRQNLCEILRASLPSYDAIITALAKNGAWWESFRQKTRVVTQAEPIEPLRTFAAQAYTSTSAAKLGVLAVAYARTLGSGEAQRMFGLVDNLVISDMTVVTSLDGMECLVLLAKTYTDIGQPRRAWLMWRRGLAFAQLLGLHRAASADDARQRLWLAIYHGDRFTSLLLGLPHGFSDSHLLETSASSSVSSTSFEQWVTEFIHECAVVAGQVIESILSPANPSFATAMQLDERLTKMYNSAPTGWWDLPATISGSPTELAGLVDRLLVHFFYFHVRMYTHIPFLKSSSPSASYSVSRSVCTEAARNLLKRFLILRTEVDGVSLFDCKTSDFVGFTAAVTFLIGLGGADEQVLDLNDSLLLSKAEGVFERLQDSGCKVESQCRNALAFLCHRTRDVLSKQEVFIPYFGKVTRSGRSASTQTARQAFNAVPTPSASSSEATLAPPTVDHEPWGNIDYCGYQGQEMAMGAWLAGGLVENHSESFQGLDLTSLDIDQDWSLFLDPT